jgi:hypothetical protein
MIVCDISYRFLWYCEIYHIPYCDSVRYIVSISVTLRYILFGTVIMCNISYQFLWHCVIYHTALCDCVRYNISIFVTVCKLSYSVLSHCAIYLIQYSAHHSKAIILQISFFCENVQLIYSSLHCNVNSLPQNLAFPLSSPAAPSLSRYVHRLSTHQRSLLPSTAHLMYHVLYISQISWFWQEPVIGCCVERNTVVFLSHHS